MGPCTYEHRYAYSKLTAQFLVPSSIIKQARSQGRAAGAELSVQSLQKVQIAREHGLIGLSVCQSGNQERGVPCFLNMQIGAPV